MEGESMKVLVSMLVILSGLSLAADRYVMFGEFTSTG
jgi:hypothetical protein